MTEKEAQRREAWAAIRPRFESMLFALGYQEAARRTGLSVATVYAVVNLGQSPWRRTIRDIRLSVEAWEDSDSERTKSGG